MNCIIYLSKHISKSTYYMMRTNVFKFCILAILLGFFESVQAKSIKAEVNGLMFIFDSDKKEAAITQHKRRYSGDFVIPSSVTYKEVTYQVTSIDAETFSLCSRLNSITIPSSVTSINDRAFLGCRILKSITIPNSVESIGIYAFSGCIELKSVTIPKSVKSIGHGVFESCNKLSTIVVDQDNSVYDSRGNCNAIIETATNTLILVCPKSRIPSSVTAIGNGVFSGRSDLTSFKIPEGVTFF